MADLAAGRNCLWLLPDRLVESGRADELYRRAASCLPMFVDVPSAVTDVGAIVKGAEVHRRGDPWLEDLDQLPYLDTYDDGFDLGWDERAAVPVSQAPLAQASSVRGAEDELTARIAKELSIPVENLVDGLVSEARNEPYVIGIRAWAEPEDSSPRGAGIERFHQTLNSAVAAADLPPGVRPRLFVAARLQDVPAAMSDSAHLDHTVTAVHWWWGALGRLDVSVAIEPRLKEDGGVPTRELDALRNRLLRELRSETVVEICGPDIDLAERLVLRWDGRQGTLERALRDSLAVGPVPPVALSKTLARTGARHRPSPDIRQAWAGGAVASWDGRLRLHPAMWFPADPAGKVSGDGRARLSSLVAQAQQRVVLPWIEEVRHRLAERALGHLNRSVEAVVNQYLERPSPFLRDWPQRAFLELQVGELIRAHSQGAVTLPEHEATLLRLLVKVRNILSHRSVLRDATLAELCAELTSADLRAE
ncbi:hypothetical protein OG599_06670 [Streptomyces sp. NBC_01335]|uniref:hypothetical protein n=1 Tax=Streptomyces sp. NBC_01335 TaxID=2903828 RepID=UPI002E0E4FCE|nr:hypothetical protein OG599_06670 [Streptomyces sp. NBC_01335]